ncbi:MAG: GAF domain-containing sensor histidine kinase [Caldilineaceae bacterium]|jgi:signal transduction histidine kinase
MTSLTDRRITRRVLGVLGTALAVLCWAALLLLRKYVFGLPVSAANLVFELTIVAAGSAFFWYWIVSMLHRQDVEVRQQTERLQALHSATASLTTEHELRPVLQKVVDLSRALINARYGALGVLNEEGTEIDQFITSGMSAATKSRIGQLPGGRGLLGISLFDGESLRIADISKDARKTGLPDSHPDMHSFLSVPITSKGRVFGNLYLADKQTPRDAGAPSTSQEYLEFTPDDQGLLEMFAAQAAIAIEDAQLYRAARQIAVMRERERIGMDLHDGVIQSIYAIGLMLDDTEHRLRNEPLLAEERIKNAISGLNSVIRNIRAYIHDLHSPDYSGKGLEAGIEELIRELEAYSVLEVACDVDSDVASSVSQKQASELLHIVQEALTNIRRHAQASIARITLSCDDENIVLIIEDDGKGLPTDGSDTQGGHGLHNMAERALMAHGTMELASVAGSGARITVKIPLETHEESI